MFSWLTGTNLMFVLMGFYTLICAVFLVEGNYPKALYWFSACMITVSVLLMK